MIILEFAFAFTVSALSHLIADPLITRHVTSRVVWDRFARYGVGFGMILLCYWFIRRKSPTARDEVMALASLPLPMAAGVFVGYIVDKIKTPS